MEPRYEKNLVTSEAWDTLELQLRGSLRNYESTASRGFRTEFDSVPLSSVPIQMAESRLKRDNKDRQMKQYYNYLEKLLDSKQSKLEAETKSYQAPVFKSPQKTSKPQIAKGSQSTNGKNYLRRQSKSYRLSQNLGDQDKFSLIQMTNTAEQESKSKPAVPRISPNKPSSRSVSKPKTDLRASLRVVKEAVEESTPRGPVRTSPAKPRKTVKSIPMLTDEELRKQRKASEAEVHKAHIEKLREAHAKKLEQQRSTTPQPKAAKPAPKPSTPAKPKQQAVAAPQEQPRVDTTPKKVKRTKDAVDKGDAKEKIATVSDLKAKIGDKRRSASRGELQSPTTKLDKKAEELKNKFGSIRPESASRKVEETIVERDSLGHGKSVTKKVEDTEISKTEDETIMRITKITVTVSKETEPVSLDSVSSTKQNAGVDAPPSSPLEFEVKKLPTMSTEELKAKEDDIFGKLANIFSKKSTEVVPKEEAPAITREVPSEELPLPLSECPIPTSVTSTFFKKVPVPSTIPVPTIMANPTPVKRPEYVSLRDDFIRSIMPSTDKPCPEDLTDFDEILEKFQQPTKP